MRIYIVDDQKLIIEAWKNLLLEIENFQVVGFAHEFEDALLGIKSYRPDIVLLDINLKNASGIELCEKIVNEMPVTKVIGLSLHNKTSIVKKIISKGAKGYLTKNVDFDELVEAIKKVNSGETYICNEIQSKLIDEVMFTSSQENPSNSLTSKEIEVLEQIAAGLTSKEIATQFFVSVRTIETHRHNILKKLGLPNTARLISWAVQNGYLNDISNS